MRETEFGSAKKIALEKKTDITNKLYKLLSHIL